MASDELFRALTDRIARLRRRENLLAWYEGLARLAGLSACIIIGAGLADAFAVADVAAPWTLTVITLLALAGLAVAYGILPLLRLTGLLPSEDDIVLAHRVGRRFPEIKDRLANALQLYRGGGRGIVSESLILAALQTVHQSIAHLDFTLAANRSRFITSLRYSAVAVLASAAVFVLLNEPLTRAYGRLLHPLGGDQPLPFQWHVEPGRTEILQGQSVPITVTLIPQAASFEASDRLSLFTRMGETAGTKEDVVRRDTAGRYRFTLNNVRQNMTYCAEIALPSLGRKPVRSEEFTITVRKRPMVRRLAAEIHTPSYAKLAARSLEENTGDITALKGSTVHLEIEATKPLTDASVRFSDSSAVPMTLAVFSKSKAEAEFRITKSGAYHIALKDADGIESDNAVEYQLRVVPDDDPFVKLIEPAGDVDITETMQLRLLADLQDDFGLTRLILHSKLEKTSGFTPLPRDYTAVDLSSHLDPGLASQTVTTAWNLEPLHIRPEDVVSYYLEVFDNDVVSGPKSGRSEVRRLRFPSLEEILSEANKQQDQHIDKLEDLAKESADIQKDLEAIHRDLLKDKKMDWKDQEKIKQLADKQEKIQQDLKDMNKSMQNLQQKMQENNLLSQETLDKYQEMQKLLSEIDSKELNQAMMQLQQALKNLDQNQLKEAMKNLKLDQKAFKEKLDRTVELLKRIKAEQMFDQMVKQAEDLRRRQQEVNDQARKADNEKDREALAKEQEKIKQSLDRLSKNADELKDLVKSIDPNFATEELDKARRMMQQGQLSPNMDQSASAMRKGTQQEQSEQKNRQEVHSQLDSLRRQMEAARGEYRGQQNEQIMNAMRKIVYDLLVISQDQEDVMADSKPLGLGSPGYRAVTQRQAELLTGMSRVTENLIELSNRTFFVTSDLGRIFGRAIGSMQDAVSNLEERSTVLAVSKQNAAMIAVNDAVKRLLESMNQMQQGASGTGMASLMQQLGQMAQQQGGINEGTMPLDGAGNPGGLSMEQQAQLGRMLGEQQALRNSLEGMQSQIEGNQGLKDRLGDMAGQMDEVIKDMQKNNVNRKTIERQQKIFERLLDASKSIHEKDYSQKRKSETGKDYNATSPNQLPANLTDRKNKLRQELLKQKQQGYARDYEWLIEQYFEALGNLPAGDNR